MRLGGPFGGIQFAPLNADLGRYFGTTDGILVRASVIDPDAAKAQALLLQFLQQLILGSTPVGRSALLGRR